MVLDSLLDKAGRAYSADISDTAQRSKDGKINAEDAKEEIFRAPERALISAAISKTYDLVADIVVSILKVKIPMLAPVVETVAISLRELVVEEATNVLTKAVDKLKS